MDPSNGGGSPSSHDATEDLNGASDAEGSIGTDGNVPLWYQAVEAMESMAAEGVDEEDDDPDFIDEPGEDDDEDEFLGMLPAWQNLNRFLTSIRCYGWQYRVRCRDRGR